MLDRLKRIGIRRLLAAASVMAAGAVFLLLGPPKLLEKSESPEFCGSCHSMTEQHLSWSHSMHRTVKCVECHLPNDHFVNHYFWKALDGGKDLFFELFPRQEHYRITLTEHGGEVLQANCIQCHEAMVSRMNLELNCFQCHRKIGHKLTSDHLSPRKGEEK